jgi:hypothetical protein
MRDDDISALRRRLRERAREDLVVMEQEAQGELKRYRERLVVAQQKAQRDLKRYEDALSIATTVLDERRQ